METNLSKKEIRHNLEGALIREIERMEGSQSSKKIRKAIKKVSKDIALKVKVDMNKKFRKAAKRIDHVNKKGNKGPLITAVKKLENA